ncbi:MAG TPA: hypothetical protein VJC06_00125 [Candidatus Paceibacterota bacterium]
MKITRIGVPFTILVLLLVGFTYSSLSSASGGGNSLVYEQNVAKTQVQIKTTVQDEPQLCHLASKSDAKLASLSVTAVLGQEQGEPQQPEGDKRCERPDPNGDPNVGGTDPDKIGCLCERKCINGKPSENYENDKRCKVHCKPDHCDCPDPCPKT